MDTYKNFAELSAIEKRGIDYEIIREPRDPETVIIAPHGGCIEPGTLEIARFLAGSVHSLYGFQGLPSKRPCKRLHITSHHFDEPTALSFIQASSRVIAIHGRRDSDNDETIWMGGRNTALKDRIASFCDDAGFPTRSEGHNLMALHQFNICNRGKTAAGVQLEIPRSTRDSLVANDAKLRRFVAAITAALA